MSSLNRTRENKPLHSIGAEAPRTGTGIPPISFRVEEEANELCRPFGQRLLVSAITGQLATLK